MRKYVKQHLKYKKYQLTEMARVRNSLLLCKRCEKISTWKPNTFYSLVPPEIHISRINLRLWKVILFVSNITRFLSVIFLFFIAAFIFGHFRVKGTYRDSSFRYCMDKHAKLFKDGYTSLLMLGNIVDIFQVTQTCICIIFLIKKYLLVFSKTNQI